uniref:Chloroplast envelope membrane protein n=1 Tax=Oryza brachyantha TaxID=4533 RepID=J3MEP6_ORYBR
GFMKLEELFILHDMIKGKSNTHVPNAPEGIHKEIVHTKIDNEGHLHIILHFSTNITCLAILSGFFLGQQEIVILNSWVQELFFNL